MTSCVPLLKYSIGVQYKQLVEVICKNMYDVDRPTSQSMAAGRSEEDRQDILKDRKKVNNLC